eukprot:TRINITY_DN19953_c0_g1_i3.p1 TRINITY_DN19953_c0_g1~~TRINITY_DN19953_c0_g1_i3.p1  ORF type:complete len:341 (+),score=92.43 TRINITY_DN19953_c0_g1_i3:110-1132(+)
MAASASCARATGSRHTIVLTPQQELGERVRPCCKIEDIVQAARAARKEAALAASSAAPLPVAAPAAPPAARAAEGVAKADPDDDLDELFRAVSDDAAEAGEMISGIDAEEDVEASEAFMAEADPDDDLDELFRAVSDDAAEADEMLSGIDAEEDVEASEAFMAEAEQLAREQSAQAAPQHAAQGSSGEQASRSQIRRELRRAAAERARGEAAKKPRPSRPSHRAGQLEQARRLGQSFGELLQQQQWRRQQQAIPASWLVVEASWDHQRRRSALSYDILHRMIWALTAAARHCIKRWFIMWPAWIARRLCCHLASMHVLLRVFKHNSRPDGLTGLLQVLHA